jgi:hypothetical protein
MVLQSKVISATFGELETRSTFAPIVTTAIILITTLALQMNVFALTAQQLATVLLAELTHTLHVKGVMMVTIS